MTSLEPSAFRPSPTPPTGAPPRPSKSDASPVSAAEREPPEELYVDIDLNIGFGYLFQSPHTMLERQMAQEQVPAETKKEANQVKGKEKKEVKESSGEVQEKKPFLSKSSLVTAATVLSYPVMLAGMLIFGIGILAKAGLDLIKAAAKNHINADLKGKTDHEINDMLNKLVDEGKNRYYMEKPKIDKDGTITTRVIIGADSVVSAKFFKITLTPNTPPAKIKYSVSTEVTFANGSTHSMASDEANSLEDYIKNQLLKDKNPYKRLKQGEIPPEPPIDKFLLQL